MSNNWKLFSILILLMSCSQKHESSVLYQSENYTLYSDKIVQGANIAEVVSDTHIKSNYQSPASATYSSLIKFKFSINEHDNELPAGCNHWVIIDREHEAPLVVFGENSKTVPSEPGTYLPANYEYTFNVDVSNVFQQFEKQGYFETYDGSHIAKSDFKGIFIAGDSEPLSWDFANLGNRGLKMQQTENSNIYTITIKLNPCNEQETQNKEWKLSQDITSVPQYHSQQPIVDALFNMAQEEAILNVEPDSTFRTGAMWGGVWTRDVSYSTLLAFAYHNPEVAKISLRRKVKRGRIIQDTGSGGAWPVSSDRTTWCLAAWEIFQVTGDTSWLNEVYPIIKNTIDDDIKTVYNRETGLYMGESSFLDWREQSYPRWMDNRDIFASQNLGTNIVHCQSLRILAEMARLKEEAYNEYTLRADSLANQINQQLWMHDKGYYAQYLYGRREFIQSSRFEALGEALAILTGVADSSKAVSIISSSPLTEFGATCFYPQIPVIPPYHNNAVWPFVQAFWNLAAAKIGNEDALVHGLASIYRPAGLFLSNYENMVAENGDFNGTQINSNRMLWSMAGNLAMVHRVFMGMEFRNDGLFFNPKVPKVYGGDKTLSNFKYRGSILNITVKGFGARVQKVSIDGKQVSEAFIPCTLTGKHQIVIEMDNMPFPHKGINIVKNHFSLAEMKVVENNNQLIWNKLKGAREYRIYRNGKYFSSVNDTIFRIEPSVYASYMVSSVDSSGWESFASEPLLISSESKVYEAERYIPGSDLPYSNFSGEGFIELSMKKNLNFEMSIDAVKEGTYWIDFRYSNGSGPWNTDNKCAIRSISINGSYVGVVIFPQRGTDEWSNWGFTNSTKVHLKKGKNNINLHFEVWNNNMNLETNTAMLDFMRVVKGD